MKGAAAFLRSAGRRGFWRALRNRALAFASWALVAWTMALALASLGIFSRQAYHFALYALLSTFPAFLFAPFHAGSLKAIRRANDKGALFEAWVETGDAEAKAFLGARAEALARELSSYDRRPEPFPRKLWMMMAASLAFFLAFQLFSIAFSSGPTLGYPTAATGRRVATRSEEDIFTRRAMGDKAADDRAAREERVASGQGVPSVPDLDEKSLGDLARALQRAASSSPDQDGGEGSERSPRQEGNPNPGKTPGRGEGREGARQGEEGQEPGQGAESRSAGFEGGGESLSVDPLPSYRAAMEKALSRSGGGPVALSSETSLAELDRVLAGYYEDFSLTLPLASEEDELVEAVKRRYTSLGERR